MERAVEKQVMSDVPVGVFISGGLDSSILATLAARFIGVNRVHTFSAKFAETSYDESGDAAILASRIHTRHVPVRTDERARCAPPSFRGLVFSGFIRVLPILFRPRRGFSLDR